MNTAKLKLDLRNYFASKFFEKKWRCLGQCGRYYNFFSINHKTHLCTECAYRLSHPNIPTLEQFFDTA